VRDTQDPDGSQWQATAHLLAVDNTFEMFRELPQCAKYLRPQVTLTELDRIAQSQSDTEAALAMQRAKRNLSQGFQQRTHALMRRTAKTKTFLRRESQDQVGGSACLPLVGPERSKNHQKGDLLPPTPLPVFRLILR
jgi:hypothetical protein